MRSPGDNRARLLYSAYTRKVENAVEAARANLASKPNAFCRMSFIKPSRPSLIS